MPFSKRAKRELSNADTQTAICLRFVADISKKKCKQGTNFENLRIITQKGDMKTTQMTPFFFICFSSPNCLGNSFFP